MKPQTNGRDNARGFKTEGIVETPEPDKISKTHTSEIRHYSYPIPKNIQHNCRFLSREESTEVHGYDIGGLIYVSSTSRQTFDHGPAIIDPALPVDHVSVNERLGYWPEYASLTPGQRYQYLVWLSNGRVDSHELGFVFLYFYGFERYVLRDAAHDIEARRDKNLADITADLHRLKSIFRENRSFCDYANQLLDVICVLYWPDRISERKAVFPNKQPIAATFAIARIASVTPGQPLDSDWALHWLLSVGPLNRTKALRQQYPILRSVFKAVYETATDGGLVVPACESKLEINIKPASRDLDPFCRLDVPSDWCDPTDLRRPMSTLLAISDVVMPALREIAKSVATNNVAGILSAWPLGVPTDTVPKLKKLVDHVTTSLQKNSRCEVEALGEYVGVTFDDRATKSKLKQMASALASCGYVMVPDPALIAVAIKLTDKVSTYPGSRIKELSPHGKWIALSVQVASLLSLVDEDDVNPDHRASFQTLVECHPHDAEKTYLMHYIDWQLLHPPNAAGLKRQIGSLSTEQIKNLARLLVLQCESNAKMADRMLKRLKQLFARLGIANCLVAELLAASPDTTSGDDAIATIVEPTANVMKDPFVPLDEAALRRHAESTTEIQRILHQFFKEEAEDKNEPAGSTSAAAITSWHSGLLDDSHDQLATWLLTQDEWPMIEVASKCQSLGIMADGSLEAINNAAFDVLGDSLLEIGDPVAVYRDILSA